MKIDLTKIIKAFKLGDKENVLTELSYIQDYFEYERNNIENLDDTIEILISNAITCQDNVLLEEILYTLQKASYQNLKNANFDLLANNIYNIRDTSALISYIIILGYSQQPRYIPLIESFANYSDMRVVQEVKDALIELEYYKNKLSE